MTDPTRTKLVPVDAATVDYIARFGGVCRDCAEHRKRRGGEAQWSGWLSGLPDYAELGNGWEVQIRPVVLAVPSVELDRILNGNELWEALFNEYRGAVPDEMTDAMLGRVAASLRGAVESAAAALLRSQEQGDG